ncbi:MAG: hypothetical protein LBJ91_02695 [Clostridiales Family XIII bacterium]|nr:hypothetical protein [Clostridiales Family XIII bacterium]
MSVLTHFPAPGPDYSKETSDSFTYDRVRLTGDYYKVTMSGSKNFASLAVSGLITTVPEKYRPTMTVNMGVGVTNTPVSNYYANVATNGKVSLGGTALSGGSCWILFSGSWIHKGD